MFCRHMRSTNFFVIRRKVFRVETREDNSWLKKVRNLEVNGESGRGRPCKPWEQVIKEDLDDLDVEVKEDLDVRLHRIMQWRSAIT